MAKKRGNGIGKTVTTCIQCGKSFETHICHLEAGRSKFCSRECYGAFKHISGTKTIICEQCGKEFERIKYMNQRFCSRKCSGKAGRTRQLVKCLNCGKEFYSVPARLNDGKDSCCSRECALEYKKRLRPKVVCENCGKHFTTFPSTPNRKFCSNSCKHEGMNKRAPDGKKKQPVVRNCKACGKEFTVPFPSRKAENCSKICSQSHRKIDGYGYEAAFKRIGWVEKMRRDPDDTNAAQFKCYNCDKWFTPTRYQVSDRIKAVEALNAAELHLYCSDDCKTSCSVYGQVVWPKGLNPRSNYRNEILDPDLNNLVLNRDSYQCQKCGATEDLHVHHIEGVAQEPMLANDLDNCLTVCHSCHSEIHSVSGCTYFDYQRAACYPDIKEAVNQQFLAI